MPDQFATVYLAGMQDPSKSRPKGATRDKLIDAALAIAARDGLSATSVKSIAREAGLTPGLVHYHFATKDDVLLAAVERAGNAYVAALDDILQNHASDGILRAYNSFAASSLFDHKRLFSLRLALKVRAIHEPALAARLASGDRLAIDRIAAVIARHRGNHSASDGDRLRAATIKAGFEGLMLAWLAHGEFDMPAAFEAFSEMIRASLDQAA